MNSKGHLTLSAIKSALRILSCIICLFNRSIITLSVGFLVAELLGVAEELVDKR